MAVHVIPACSRLRSRNLKTHHQARAVTQRLRMAAPRDLLFARPGPLFFSFSCRLTAVSQLGSTSFATRRPGVRISSRPPNYFPAFNSLQHTYAIFGTTRSSPGSPTEPRIWNPPPESRTLTSAFLFRISRFAHRTCMSKVGECIY